MITQHASATPDLPLDMIIFGGSGDLSFRKLLPALYMAHLHCNLPPETRILTIGRKPWSREEYLNEFMEAKAQALHRKEGASMPPRGTNSSRCSSTCAWTSIRSDDYQRLKEASRERCWRVFYLATAPDLFTNICDNLSDAGLIDEHSRVVLEKPLGHDLASAQAINDCGRPAFQRSADLPDRPLPRQGNGAEPDGAALRQRDFRPAVAGAVYQERADHGGGNGRRGSRAGFYDKTGALRDMVQNHLLQLLCIVAMEPPVSLDPDAVRDEKLKVLRSLRPMTPDDIARDTVRGQYTAGAVGRRSR